MNLLDNLSFQQKLDKENLYSSITNLYLQCQHAFREVQLIKVPSKPIQNLIMSGMGGSGLAARIVQSLYADQLPVPLYIINDYHLPIWANSKTLIICSSYSGTTEETVQTLKEALVKKCQIIVICAGGELAKLAQKYYLPIYKINPKYNLSKQPRMAIGYSLIGQLALLSQAGLLKLTSTAIASLKPIMAQIVDHNKRELPQSQNPAKKLATAMHSKQIIMVAAEHLTGAFHVIKNQMNENAKQLSHRHDLPELNHHLMEGLKFPETNKKHVVFWMLNSLLYSKRMQTRVDLTLDVINKNGLNAVEFVPQAKTKLAQVFEVIQFGAFVNYYLSVLNKLNPTPIPWVDYFKAKLIKACHESA
ncbi:MAG: SIS domain-containing protein [Candidatus Beckwithbacteria bacterium]